MKRSNWVRLIAVILIISMLAAPVSAATNRGNDGVRTNGVVGIIVDFIRDIIRDIFDDWFDEPGEEEPTPTTPVNPTTPTPTQPGETEPEETDPTEPGETKPTQPGETEPEETDPTEPGETEPEEDEDKPETTMQLIEGYENTENGHLLRGHSYSLSELIAQQNSKPATTTTANRFGTKLGNGLGGNSASTGLKPMGGLHTNPVATTEASTPVTYTAVESITVAEVWAASGGTDANTWYRTPYFYNYNSVYYPVEIYLYGGNYLVSYLNSNGSHPANPSGLGLRGADEELTCLYVQTAAESTKIEGITGNANSYDVGENAVVSNAFDGNVNTYWATAAGGNVANCYLIADLGGEYTIDKVQYTKRIFNGSYDCTGNLLNYTIEVSTDGTTWKQVAIGNTQNGTTAITFDAVEATHVRLTSSSSYHWQMGQTGQPDNRNTVMTCAEFEVFGIKVTEPEQPTPDPDPEPDPDPTDPVDPDMPDPGMVEVIPFSKLTWEQVKNGKVTYYRNDKCTNPVKVVEKNNGASYELVDSEGDVVATLNGNNLSQRIGVTLFTPSYIVFFPVTMYDYNDDTINAATHALEAAANPDLTEWQGIYFNGGTPDPVTYGSTDFVWVDGGQYYIQNCRASANIPSTSWIRTYNNKIYADSKENATLWTLTIEDGKYYLSCDIDGVTNYLIVGTNGDTDGYTTTKTPVELVNYNGDTYEDAVQIRQNGHHLCQWGNEYARDFGGYNENNDSGNAMWFYLVTDNGEQKMECGDGIRAGFADWNFWSKNSGSNANGDLFYTGLVQPELVNDEIVFTVPDGGIFNKNTDVKDIYEFVGMPYILNSESGVYSFDSDYHGAYFSGGPQSGTENAPHNLHFALEAPQPMPNGLGVGDGSTNAFLPYNNQASYNIGDVNYHFGMRADLPFSMTTNGRIKETDDNSTPITFTFSGDDDVWIFIDGKLVADLGGIHNRLDITLDFAANTITYFEENSQDTNNNTSSYNDTSFATTQKLFNDTEGNGLLGMTRPEFASNVNHELQFFYLERGEGTSNCHIEFNLPMRDTILVTKDITKSWSEKQDEDDGEGDGTAPLTSKEQAAVNKLDFHFKLWKKEAGGEFQVVANTNFILQDQDGNFLGIQSTGPDGKFSLKNQQTAKFMTEIPRTGVTYYVEEIELDHNTFLTPDYNYKGEATYGMNYEGDYLDPTEDDENHTSHVKDFTKDASLIPEHELPMDAEVLKSYDFTAMGSIESRDYLEFICTNYLNAELPNPTARAYEDIIVIDYGLPVQIDPLQNDLFRGEDIEIVAWGDEALTLSEKLDEHGFAIDAETTWTGNKVLAAAYVSNGTTYSSTPVDMADCLYTFKKNADGTYEIFSTTADGTKVYLNQYTTDIDRVPNDSIPGKISVSESTHENMFRLLANEVEGGTGNKRTLHFHSDAAMPFWNRCGNDTSKKCSEYLYRPASANDQSSTEIPGYVMVTRLDEIKDGGQYLIVHDSDVDSNLYVLHPSTSTSQWDHVAKVGTTTSPAIGTSFSFDSGNVTFKDKTYAEYEHKNEKNETYYTYDRDTFEYELTEQLTEVEEINYIIKVTSTVKETVGNEEITKTACRYALGKIYIVPATIMYYEENFSDMITFEGDGWDKDFTVSNQNNVSDFQEPGVVGTIDDSTYGSDVAYLSDNGDSNGTHRYGKTDTKAIRFTYTFTGTGTSIFARTSALTGYMQVKIYEGTDIYNDDGTLSSDYMDVYYRDTYWEDTNGSNLDASGTLYNIPVYTNEDLEYGTYTVVCTVAKMGTLGAGKTQPLMKQTAHNCYNEKGEAIWVEANTKDHRCRDQLGRELEAMQSGNEFYLDGIRVMQPLNEYAENTELTGKALAAYATDGESNLDVVTLRQKLITDAEEGDAIWDGENFVVLTDTNGAIVKASDYKSIGPKEEVYLAPGQKVSFSLKSWEPEGLKLYMGMKAPFGNAKVHVGHDTYELKNAPDCYYDVTDNYESLVTETDEDGYEYYVVTYTFEAAESIVSLTNIKVVGQYEFTIVEDFDGDSNE